MGVFAAGTGPKPRDNVLLARAAHESRASAKDGTANVAKVKPVENGGNVSDIVYPHELMNMMFRKSRDT